MEVERSQPSDFGPTPPKAARPGSPPESAKDESRLLVTFVAVLVAFKLLGLAVIAVFMFQAGIGDAIAFLVATHLPFVAAGLVLLYFPTSALVRRVRVRARRRKLIWAEWHVEEAPTTSR